MKKKLQHATFAVSWLLHSGVILCDLRFILHLFIVPSQYFTSQLHVQPFLSGRVAATFDCCLPRICSLSLSPSLILPVYGDKVEYIWILFVCWLVVPLLSSRRIVCWDWLVLLVGWLVGSQKCTNSSHKQIHTGCTNNHTYICRQLLLWMNSALTIVFLAKSNRPTMTTTSTIDVKFSVKLKSSWDLNTF